MTDKKPANIFKNKHKERLAIVQKVISGEKTQVRAGFELGISARQVRRIAGRVRVLGDFGVVHGNTGKASKNCLNETILSSTKKSDLHQKLMILYPYQLILALVCDLVFLENFVVQVLVE